MGYTTQTESLEKLIKLTDERGWEAKAWNRDK